MNACLTRERMGWVFVSPWIVGFLLLTLVPLLVSLYMAFHEWDMFSDPVFVGLDNFKKLLNTATIEGQTFFAALSNTLIYTVCTAVINIVLGIAIAWAVARSGVLNTVMRSVIYLPCMVIGVAFSMMMGPIFGSSDYAFVNQILHAVGLPPQEWLFTHGQGVWVMVFMSFWGIGGAMIVFVAGIKTVDQSVYDAASIDGASNFKLLTKICVPMISPVIVYQTIMSLIFGMQVFDIAVGLSSAGGTGGSFGMGIDNSLATLVFYLYNKGFRDFEMGMASAIGWLIFLITSVVSVGLFAFVRKTGYFKMD